MLPTLISCAQMISNHVLIKLRWKSPVFFPVSWQMTITDFYLAEDVSKQVRRGARSWTFQMFYQKVIKSHKILFRSSEETFVVFFYFVSFLGSLLMILCLLFPSYTSVSKFCSRAINKVTVLIVKLNCEIWNWNINYNRALVTSITWDPFLRVCFSLR